MKHFLDNFSRIYSRLKNRICEHFNEIDLLATQRQHAYRTDISLSKPLVGGLGAWTRIFPLKAQHHVWDHYGLYT